MAGALMLSEQRKPYQTVLTTIGSPKGERDDEAQDDTDDDTQTRPCFPRPAERCAANNWTGTGDESSPSAAPPICSDAPEKGATTKKQQVTGHGPSGDGCHPSPEVQVSDPPEVVRKDGSSGLAAWGYSWEPFRVGNTAAVRHGAYSDRIVGEKIAKLAPEFRDWLAGNAPWAAAEPFAPLVLNYLRSSAVLELLLEAVVEGAQKGGPASVPTRRFETLLAALRGQREALRDMGLTPGTKAELAHTVAGTEATLADLAAEGREILARRQAGQAAQEVLDAEPDDEVTE